MDTNSHTSFKSTLSDATEIKLRTTFNKRNFTIDWFIDNFWLLCNKPKGDYIESPSFSMSSDKSLSWNLWLYPNGTLSASDGFISLYLMPKFKGKVSVRCTYFLLDSNDKIHYKKSFSNIFRGEGVGYGSGDYIKKDFLLNEANHLLINGSLRFYFELQIVSDIVISQSSESYSESTVIKTDWKVSELNKLLDNSDVSDIKLIVGVKEFNIHKVILAARSPVFAAMFSHPLKESNTNIMEITDFSAELMEEVIKYIYTGCVPNLRETVEDFLQVADKYDLCGLKEMCSNELCTRLTINNAAQMLVLADLCNVSSLKSFVITFVEKNIRQVLSEPSWKEWLASKSPLVAEVNTLLLFNNLCITTS